MATCMSEEDEIAQFKGVTQLLYCSDNLFASGVPLPIQMMRLKEFGDVFLNLPMRVTSVHVCYNTPNLEPIPSILRVSFNKEYRLRLKAHLGSDIEVKYTLMTYGIRHPCFEGKERMDLYQKYIQRRLQLEQEEKEKLLKEETASGIIRYPKKNDVLVGRGHPYQNYFGNELLGDIVASQYYQQRIQETNNDRFEKTCVYLDVVKTLDESYGSRFLERTDQGWKIANQDAVRRKVCSAFRKRKTTKGTTKSLPMPVIAAEVPSAMEM